MHARILRKLAIIFLVPFVGCETGNSILRLFGGEYQSKAIGHATQGSPNEEIQYQAHEAHQQLNRPFF
jgi:hypothetical protein